MTRARAAAVLVAAAVGGSLAGCGNAKHARPITTVPGVGTNSQQPTMSSTTATTP